MKATIRSFFLTILLTIPFLSDAQPVNRSQYDSFTRIYKKGITHRKKLMQKLHANSTPRLLKIAKEKNILGNC